MVTWCWTTLQLLEFVKRSRYSNRAVIVIRAFSIQIIATVLITLLGLIYVNCLLKVPMSQLHGIALS